jgi:hypothetical protein
MKAFKTFILFSFGISLILWGCMDAPDMSPVPKISFKNIAFKPSSTNPDSLIIYIEFEDGDGDLGLAGNELNPPYHEFEYIKDANGQRIKFGSSPDLPPYNCTDWIRHESDTFLVKFNENRNNYFIDFYRKTDGEYEKLTWRRRDSMQDCEVELNFNGRFPILFNNTKGGPLIGTLRYGIANFVFRSLRNDTLMLEIFIKDRALNKSNVIQTPDFTLPGITVE